MFRGGDGGGGRTRARGTSRGAFKIPLFRVRVRVCMRARALCISWWGARVSLSTRVCFFNVGVPKDNELRSFIFSFFFFSVAIKELLLMTLPLCDI